MASNKEEKPEEAGSKRGVRSSDQPGTPKRKTEDPGWSTGLRQLYHSVVEEPLPDSFKDLLDQLDDQSDDESIDSAAQSAHEGGADRNVGRND
jgi:hypothetical protein